MSVFTSVAIAVEGTPVPVVILSNPVVKPARFVPFKATTVTALVPEVVASPERSVFVIVVEEANLVRFPVVGEPEVETLPPPAGVAQEPSPLQKVEEEIGRAHV